MTAPAPHGGETGNPFGGLRDDGTCGRSFRSGSGRYYDCGRAADHDGRHSAFPDEPPHGGEPCRDCGKPLATPDELGSGLCLRCLNGPVPGDKGNRERAAAIVGSISPWLDHLAAALDAAEARGRSEAAAKIEALAVELDVISDEHYAAYKHGDPSDTRRGSPYTEGFCVGYDSAAQRLHSVAAELSVPGSQEPQP